MNRCHDVLRGYIQVRYHSNRVGETNRKNTIVFKSGNNFCGGFSRAQNIENDDVCLDCFDVDRDAVDVREAFGEASGVRVVFV